jgi:DNA-binding HxlR family transcriptional regulator
MIQKKGSGLEDQNCGYCSQKRAEIFQAEGETIACNAGRVRQHTQMSDNVAKAGGDGADDDFSRVANIWRMLGKKWTSSILNSVGSVQVARFTEIKNSLEGISGTVLSERLLELEREGLVTKEIYNAVPPKVEYRLTDSARELVVILKELDGRRARWKVAAAASDVSALATMPS